MWNNIAGAMTPSPTSAPTSALPPESWTARRLEHATPAHLHATTRRTFIGPIPEGWLKSHRKSWYKDYISKGGDRAPTFIAAQDVVPASVAGAGHQEQGSEEAVAPGGSEQSLGAESTTSLLWEQRNSTRNTYGTASGPVNSKHDGSKTNATPAAGKLTRARLDHPRTGEAVDRIAAAVPKVRFSESTKLQLRQRARRLAHKGTLRWGKIKDGEILKMDRMLVRADVTTQSVGNNFDERVSAGVITKPLDKWREFMVVCRKQKEDGAESVLQLYQTRVIAASAAEQGKTKKKPKIQIALDTREVSVNLFSSLDKMLCLWTREGTRTTIYYLRAQSGANAVDWYTFLATALGFQRPKILQINVPDLSVSLRLNDPFSLTETTKVLIDAAEGDDAALQQAMQIEKNAANAIINRCVAMLNASPEWEDILKHWTESKRIGLAWKRYDRLEWVHGEVQRRMYGTIAMARTHELELRPKDHYPLTIKNAEGNNVEEPAPVEGFLIRLTSQQGLERKMGRMLYKRLYFTTQNQYLFFLKPPSATPPPPPDLKLQPNCNVPSSRQLFNQAPLCYDVDPYPLEEGNISWLDTESSRTAADRRAKDGAAEAEAERNAQMVMACDGFINLCDVVRVRKMRRGATPVDDHLDEGDGVLFNESSTAEVGRNDTNRDDGATKAVDDDRTFELVLKNGLIVRLQAYNEEAKNEWIKRLRQLVQFWQLRATADMELYKSVRQENLSRLQIDERAEAVVGSFASRWEVSHSFASSVLYNMCGIAQCRTIHLSGLLFRKPRRHATFTRCYVVLCHGHLLIFQDTFRKHTGRRVQQIHHERIASIYLKGCYLYSGLLTENDLLYQNRTFDPDQPGHHALPRVYLEDAWTSTDEDAMTTFVIWHAKSKSWFRSSQTVDDVKKRKDAEAKDAGGAEGHRLRTKKKLTRVSQLGATGRSVVFKARSRAERDHWVMAVQVEIERLASVGPDGDDGDDVRLVGQDGA